MSFAGAVLRDRGVRWIGLGWCGFLAENIVLSENRTWIISEVGDTAYHATYSALSTAATASIAWGLFRHGRTHTDEHGLYRQGALQAFRKPLGSSPGRIVLSAGLSALGLIGFSQLAPKLQVPVEINSAQQKPEDSKPTSAKEVENKKAGFFRPKCPMDFRPVDMPEDGVYGLRRVTRNPNFWSLGLLGAGVAVASTTAPQVVAFGFPLVFALVGGAHQDSRFRRGMGGEEICRSLTEFLVKQRVFFPLQVSLTPRSTSKPPTFPSWLFLTVVRNGQISRTK